MIDDLKDQVKVLKAQVQEKKMTIDEEKVKYVRRAYMNTRRAHDKRGFGYVEGSKHNSRVNLNGNDFVKFTKEGSYQKKQEEKSKTTDHSTFAHNVHAYASHTPTMSFKDFDASYVLMKNKHGRVIAKYVGPHNKRPKTCVWIPKCLITNLRGPKQSWVPKTKT